MSAAAVAERAGARAYACYGRVYRAERAGRSGMWWGVGRARGRGPAYLDKLGPRATREAMQEALDGWAARLCLRPADFSTQRRGGAEEGRHGQR